MTCFLPNSAFLEISHFWSFTPPLSPKDRKGNIEIENCIEIEVELVQVSMPRLHTKLVVTDYTLDPSHAKAETAVDPTGLIAFARLAPDAQSRPDLQQPPRGRSRSHNRQQQSLQARPMLASA